MSVLSLSKRPISCLIALHGPLIPFLLISAARTAQRNASGRSGCGEDPSPRCSPENLAKKETCPGRKDGKKDDAKRKSMWQNPDCCIDICKDALPRFDDLYYKASDKNRQYVRTWSECPEFSIVPKKLCCFEKLDLPPIQRREHSSRMTKTACPVSDKSKFLMICQSTKDSKCTKISLPCCRPARDPPRCKSSPRPPTDCVKICAPYPSYSECDKEKRKAERMKECSCLYPGPVCRIV